MELLAPAGNMECLKAAVNNGADAVYFAGKSFGARSFADNFSPDEIRDAAKFCRLRDVKTYVTVNTMTLDREFKELDEFITLLADAGVDGVIVQDLGVLKRISEICPELPIHGSTQMTVHNLDGVLTLEKLGVKRVVLSRELSKSDMEYILKNCNMEIEVFVHGAMCMSYSGQCLMSSVLGGRSGNRGKCAQPCRLGYHAGGGKDRFYLSLKDMSLVNHLEGLKEMGVASLKIEGRMKGADYVAEVVKTYRRCIDESRTPSKKELDRINRVFFRGGMTDGYFMGRTGTDMFAFDKPDDPYKKGEGLTAEAADERTVGISCRAEFTEGEFPKIILSTKDKEAVVYGETPLDTAMKSSAHKEDIEKQLRKTGETAFTIADAEVTVNGNPFVPVKTVNELRRKAVESLENAIMAESKKEIKDIPLILNKRKNNTEMKLTASVQTFEQYSAVKEFTFEYIDVPLHVLAENSDSFLEDRERIIINPSVIIKDSERAEIESELEKLINTGFKNLRAENIDRIKNIEDFNIFGGARLNIANSEALKAFEKLGLKGVCLSAELNLAQIRDLDKSLKTEAVIYGHTPLMITENCILKNMGKCPCRGSGEIYDRKNRRLFIIKDGKSCRNIVLNSVPLYMGDKIADLKSIGIDYGRLDFTIESIDECREICQNYLTEKKLDREFTRLHFYKGVL